ncbi:hypothetical protein MMYC01_210373 [Madurella mycetomatis]|uniref:Uncharacterized protein n=1 Tax=Madurella mycetomatis TaxID=100816 RepID=A0A175VQV4_9PEZI|nr:hypothetical protein MMYC01_210373 [Madurella mycetomatis]
MLRTCYSGISLLPEQPEIPPPPFATILLSRDRDFADCGDILEQIDKRCPEPAARVAFVGLSGVGRSQPVIGYAYKVAEQYAAK